MTAGVIVAVVAVCITVVLNIGALGSMWGGLKARLTYQDERLEDLSERAERTESLLSGLATRVEVRFATEAAGAEKRPRRRRKRS